MDSPNIREAHELVEKLGQLEARKKEMTASIDTDIDQVRKRLGKLLGIARGTVSSNGHAANEPKETGEGPTGEGPAARTLKFLGENPGAGFDMIAVNVYGRDDDDSIAKARDVVYYLRKRGRVQKIKGKRGQWEVTTENA